MGRQPGFVYDLGGGKPAIRWGRVALFVFILTGGTLSSLGAITYFFGADPQWVMVLPQVSAMMIYLVIGIEAERQKIIVGKWSCRFSLAAMMVLTLFIALFMAIVVHIVQQTQREFAFTSQAISAIQSINQGGNSYNQSRTGRFVVCVNRPDFNDQDLAQVIAACTAKGESNCRIVTLAIWGTAVTDEGLAQLEKCPQLETLSTSVGPFSETAKSRLSTLRKLKDITLDQNKFTQSDLDDLRKILGPARVNGQ